MSKTYTSINKALGIPFERQVPESIEVIESKPIKEKKEVVKFESNAQEYAMTVAEAKETIANNFAEDYEFIRTTLRDLMTEGMNSLEVATELATDSESPRAFEVCTSIITTISGLGKELTNLHKEAMKMADSNKEVVEQTTVVNNTQINNYNPSPKELQLILDTVEEVVYDDKELE